MVRPKLRPTLSRKNKYMCIAPTAQTKLGKEARRGSHDLRKLVGHANFLDVLVDELEPHEEEEEAAEEVVTPQAASESTGSGSEEVEELEKDDGSDSEEWSDESDDEDHMLFRTASGRPATGEDHGAHVQIQTSPGEAGGDYFQHWSHGEAMGKVEEARQNVSANLQNYDKDGEISVIVSSSLAELMSELEAGGPTSPSEETAPAVKASA